MNMNVKGKFPEPTPEEYLLREEELSTNAETRTPITVCVDCSFSMRRQQRLDRVMEGLRVFCKDMATDPIASQSVELCVISISGSMARVELDFTPPDRIRLPALIAKGETPLADGVMTALENLERRKELYRDNGNSYYRPWLILIADGDESRSSRELEEAAAALRKESEAKRLNVLCVTIGDEAQLECSSLMRLAPDGRVQYLRDLKFREFFGWLSRSIQKTSQSLSGEEVSYEPTVTWGEIIEGS